MNFWQDLWESPQHNRPPNSREKKRASDALDACLAIELAVARFYSLDMVEFWEDIREIVQSTTEKIDLLNKLETALANKMNLNGANLRPFFWEDLSEEIYQGSDRRISMTEFFASIPPHNFFGDLLGQIYQAWESEGTKNNKGSYYTSENLARNLIQAMDLPTIKNISLKDGQKKLLICDPACGSGIFFLELFRAMSPSPRFQGLDEQLEIRGFDTDPIAVWICRLNLVIWNLLRPKQAINLIECRNALAEDLSINTEHDIILGNPPFFEVPAGNYPELLRSSNRPRRVNISALFVLKYAPLLRDGGQIGFIFPRSFLFSDRWAFLRQFLSQGGYHIPRLTLYNRGFARVGLEQITLVVGRGRAPAEVTISEYDDLQESGPSSTWRIPGNLLLRPPLFSLPLFATPDVREILETVWKNSVPLGQLCDVIPSTTEPAIFRGMGWERHLSLEDSPHSWPAIKGTDIIPFGVKQYRHILRPAEQTGAPGNSPRLRFIFERPVVVCQRLVSSKTRVVAACLPRRVIPISTLTCLCLPLTAPDPSSLIVSALNSTFASYYIADHVFLHSRLSTSLDRQYLRYFPVPNPATLDPVIFRAITDLSISLETTARERKDIFVLQEEMQHLDALIYQGYGLSASQGYVLFQKLQAFWNRSRISNV